MPWFSAVKFIVAIMAVSWYNANGTGNLQMKEDETVVIWNSCCIRRFLF
jgi:hypothetical protein